jgi:hypothetical protein
VAKIDLPKRRSELGLPSTDRRRGPRRPGGWVPLQASRAERERRSFTGRLLGALTFRPTNKGRQ